MARPSGKELYNKIKQAKDAVSNDSILVIDPAVIATDAIELGYQFETIKDVLLDVLEEIGPNHYAGTRPPQKAYERKITGLELFAFRWISKRFGCDSYIKFSIKQDCIYLVSLHPHREKRGE